MTSQLHLPGIPLPDVEPWTTFGLTASSPMARLEGESIYRKVAVRMHADEKVLRLSRPPPNGYSLWLELLCGPQTDVIPGLFRIGEAGLAEQLGWPLKGFRDAWQELIDASLPVKADWKSRLVWVRNALQHNMPASPNTVLSWKDCWRDRVPECSLKEEAKLHIAATLTDFSEAYAKAFEKVCAKPSPKPSGKAFDEPKAKTTEKPNDNPSFKASANQEQLAVSSKQEDVVVAKVGSPEGRTAQPCESVHNSLPDWLKPEDRYEAQRLLETGDGIALTAFLAKCRKRGGE